MGSGRPSGIGGRVGGRGGLLGEGGCPLVLAGSAAASAARSSQVDPVGAGDGGRVGHPLPQPERAAQVAERLRWGEDGRRLLGRAYRGGQGAGQVVASQAMVGELGRGAFRLGGKQAGVGGMEPHLLAWQQVAIDRLLQQRVAERIGPGGAVGHQDAGADRLPQALLQLGLGPPGDLGEQPVGHPAAGHRRDPQHLLGRLGQRLDPGEQHIGQRRRQHDLGIAGAGGQQLLGKERVALRPRDRCAPPGPPAAAPPVIASRCSASSARLKGASSSRSTPGSRTSSASSGRSGCRRCSSSDR